MRPSLLFVALSFVAAGPAQAAIFCAANPAQIQQALATAGGNGQPDEIRIRAGVHAASTSATATHTYAVLPNDQQSIDISGGWTDAACAQRTESAAGTTLLPAPSRRLFAVLGQGGMPTVSISNLEMSFVSQDWQGCVVEASGPMNLVIQRVRIEDNDCSSVVGGQVNGGTFTIRNSLIANNRTVDALVRLMGTAALSASQSTFANNTVVGNEVSDSTYLINIRAEPGAVKSIENNVVWNNVVPLSNGVMRHFDTTSASSSQLRNNRLQQLTGAFVNGFGNTAGDPGFLSASDYRPRSGSPLVNAGAIDPVGGTTPRDVSGLSRVQGGRIDIGAFEAEYPMFAAGFEPLLD